MHRLSRAAFLATLFLVVGAPLALAQLPPLTNQSPTTPLDPAVPAVQPPSAQPEPEPTSSAGSLTGTFRIAAGKCSGAVTGSTFRMVQPGGSTSGPFVSNSDSPCADKTHTPLRPGSDGGLVAGAYQAHPSPAFNSGGHGLASRITAPQRFYGVDFATATNPVDPQTGTNVAAPDITVDNAGNLGGDVRSFAAAWNTQHFNQGAPKPDGTATGATTRPTGNYDASTGKYSLTWTSQISGGPFNNFTGVWHFEGDFIPSAGGTTGSGTTSAVAGRSTSAGGGSASTGSASGGTLASTGLGWSSGAGAVLMVAGLSLASLLRRSRIGPAGHE